MLPRSHRFPLRAHADFFATAGKVRGSFFLVLYKGQSDLQSPNQAAFIATKKNFPTAVARNRIKRQLSELLSPLLRSTSTAHTAQLAHPAQSTHPAQQLILVVIAYRPLQTNAQRQEILSVVQQLLSSTL